MKYLRMFVLAILCATFWCSGVSNATVAFAEEPEIQKTQDFIVASGSTPIIMNEMNEPNMVAGRYNSCEIESCGMGIKET